MPDVEQFDAVVLGSGEAGKSMAWYLGLNGKRVAVIERKYIGGACPNIACLPSKNLVHGAKVASYFQRGEEFGMLADKWTVSMPGVRARKRQMVEDLVQMHLDNFHRSKAEIVMGEGRFIADRTLKVSLPGEGNALSMASRSSSTPGPGRTSVTYRVWLNPLRSRMWKRWNSTLYPTIC